MTIATLTILDGNGVQHTTEVQVNGDGSYTAFHAEDLTQRAALLAALQAPFGSLGLDHSANAPTLPLVGANFGGSGPYANYALVKTVAANPTRANIDIENTAGEQIVVLRDDGTAANGAAPVNASVFALGGGSSAGAQGGGWTSTTFKGRLQLFAPSVLSGSQYICVMED